MHATIQVDDGTKQVAEPNHEVVDPLSEIPTETTVPAYSAPTVFEQGPSIPLPEVINHFIIFLIPLSTLSYTTLNDNLMV